MSDPIRLPLSVFERNMVRDHTEEYPMIQVVQAEFQGSLDPALLRTAFDLALERHPLLTAPIEGTGKQATWVFSPEVPVPKRFWSVSDSRAIPRTFAGIFDSSLGRRAVAWHVPTETGCKVIAAIDHICCDGIGLLQIFGDWFTIYHQLHQRLPVEQPDTAELIAQLPRRDLPGWRESSQKVTRWQAFRGFVRETKNWYLRKPQVIAASPRKEPVFPPATDFFCRSLSAAETRGLRNAAQARQVTLNDLLLREVFLVLAIWNAKHGKSRGRDWLRVLMPTSLRGAGDKALSAANRVGFTFLTHRVSECDNPEQLLDSLKHETYAIRQWNLGQMFLDGLTMAEKIPGLISLYMRKKSCLSTTLFSNIGEITRRWSAHLPREGKSLRVGEARFLRMSGRSPLRPGTRSGIIVNLLGDELTVSGTTDPRFFDAPLSQEWWDLLFGQLLATSAAGNAAKTAKFVPLGQ